jgi:hypothetical protein
MLKKNTFHKTEAICCVFFPSYTQIKKYAGLADFFLICCCSEIAQSTAKFPQNFVPYHHKIKYFSEQFSQNFVVKWHTIFCQILAKFSAKNPHIFFDFVVVWDKILREFGRKLCGFRKTADLNFFR